MRKRSGWFRRLWIAHQLQLAQVPLADAEEVAEDLLHGGVPCELAGTNQLGHRQLGDELGAAGEFAVGASRSVAIGGGAADATAPDDGETGALVSRAAAHSSKASRISEVRVAISMLWCSSSGRNRSNPTFSLAFFVVARVLGVRPSATSSLIAAMSSLRHQMPLRSSPTARGV